MELIYSIIMGVVQGITEFLPISSSGHLVITKSFWEDFRSPGILFEVLLHLGTLVAITIYYRRDLFDLIRSIKPGNSSMEKDGSDITNGLVNCVIPGTLISGGQTFRCGVITGSFLDTGLHLFCVTLDLSDGSSVNDCVTWLVNENTEP